MGRSRSSGCPCARTAACDGRATHASPRWPPCPTRTCSPCVILASGRSTRYARASRSMQPRNRTSGTGAAKAVSARPSRVAHPPTALARQQPRRPTTRRPDHPSVPRHLPIHSTNRRSRRPRPCEGRGSGVRSARTGVRLSLFAALALAAAAALIGGLIARRLGQSTLAGYVVAGAALGALPGGPDHESVATLADIGVLLL